MTKDVKNESAILKIKNGDAYKRREKSLSEEKGNNEEFHELVHHLNEDDQWQFKKKMLLED